MRFAVLGSPVAHSLSPRMQRAAFEASGLDATYDALDVPPTRLESALATLHREGYAGLNLTAPLKEAVRPFLRGATPEAVALGSVNTLKRIEEGWEGHATDGLGFAAWAREQSVVRPRSRVLLLGAGGAARAVTPYLARLGAATVTVVARDASRAAAVTALGERQNGGTAWSAASLTVAPDGGPFDLAVRALSTPDLAEGEAAWWDELDAGGALVDLNYGSRAESVRRAARDTGLRHLDGLGMLLHQGALSFTYWTGVAAPLEAMRRALEADSG